MPTMTRMLYSTAPMMRGDDVLATQRRLNDLGARLAPDGLYGDATTGAVRQFQSTSRIEVDGIVGPVTWQALFGAAAGPLAADPLAPESLRALREPRKYYADGSSWRLGVDGIEVDQAPVEFSREERAQAGTVLTRFKQELVAALAAHPMPIELVIANICTESDGQPVSLRMEPGCDRNNPENTPSRVSEGLMQTLLSSAREALRQPGLRLAELRRPEVSILAGVTYIAQQAHQTRFHAPLVAAAYNAGSLRYNGSAENRWRLVQYPIGTSRHVDRFVRSLNAAMAIVDDTDLPGATPTFRRLLRGDAAAAAARAGGPYVAAAPEALMGQSVGTGQCVAYVQYAAGAPHTSNWRRGGLVKGDAAVPSRTAIATFDPDDRYGNHTDGRSHAAIYLRQDEHGLVVCDQWSGQPVHQRTIRFDGDRPVNDGNAFHVIG